MGPSSTATASSSAASTRFLPNFLLPSNSPSNKHRRLSSSTASTLSYASSSSAAAPASPPRNALAHQHPALPAGALLLSGPGNAPQKGVQTRIDTRMPRHIGPVEGWWIWYQGGFVHSMLETWEFVLIHGLLLALLAVLYLAVSHLPAHVALLSDRVRYYVSGAMASPAL
ncbi:hypothetical protein JCM10213_000660 [Rhodosporidiobolus nylandii]